MKKLLYVSVAFALATFPILLHAETVPLEEEYNPHQEALACINTPCDDGDTECINECDLRCDSCHSDPVGMSGITISYQEWLESDLSLSEVYSVYTEEIVVGLADICFDCHGGSFESPENHPVDIKYDPYVSEKDLKEFPQGLFLVCEDGQGANNDCQVRCVTCHKVHPIESEGQQIAGLLRMNNTQSALCESCHLK